MYFDGRLWKVRDLGSRNGTYLNGRRLDAGTTYPLAAGDQLTFGGSVEAAWVIDAIDPPGPVARVARGGVLFGRGATLWLPAPTDPEGCVRFEAGNWTLEDATGTRVVQNGDRVVVAGETYELDLPDLPEEEGRYSESTVEVVSPSSVQLRFAPSQDEEHVALQASLAGQVIPFGARAYNYPLLVLARRRLHDRHASVSEGECGWVYAQQLREQLLLDRVALNLQLWRATQAFMKAGLPAERLIERRLDSGQLRLGFEDLIVPAQER